MIAVQSPRPWALALATASLAGAIASRPAPPSPVADPWVRYELAVLPGDVVVQDAGAGPRRPLRYAPRAHSFIDFRVSIDEPSYLGAAAPTVVSGACVVDATAAGFSPWCAIFEVIAGIPELEWMIVSADFDARGQTPAISVRHRAGLARSLTDRIAAAIMRVEPLPEEPVGSGARWEETALAGAVARTRRVELRASDGNTIELRATTTDDSGAQRGVEDGAAFELQSLRATGTEGRILDLALLGDHLAAARHQEATVRHGGATRSRTTDARLDRTTSMR